jgi:hypothetical protein
MSKLRREWGRNVRNRPESGSRAFYPEGVHTPACELPTDLTPRNPAPVLDSARLSTGWTALIIIIKEE